MGSVVCSNDDHINALQEQLRIVTRERDDLAHQLRHKEADLQQLYDSFSTQTARAVKEIDSVIGKYKI